GLNVRHLQPDADPQFRGKRSPHESRHADSASHAQQQRIEQIELGLMRKAPERAIDAEEVAVAKVVHQESVAQHLTAASSGPEETVRHGEDQERSQIRWIDAAETPYQEAQCVLVRAAAERVVDQKTAEDEEHGYAEASHAEEAGHGLRRQCQPCGP